MVKFTEYAAYRRLKALAKDPVDLSQEGVLTPARIAKFQAQACGFKLLYGTQRVDEEVLQTLEDLAREAKVIEHMQEMQKGDVINRIEGFESENRSVLHTAMRDIFSPLDGKGPSVDAARGAKKEYDKLAKFLERIEKEHGFTDLVQIGIGGSDLGPRAFYMALKAYCKPGRRVHYVSNVDPDDMAAVLGQLNLEKTLVVVVSKSGTTLETLTNETLAREYFKRAHLKPNKHFVAVTGEGSPMDNPKEYLAAFYMWDYIGGRYSVTSMVGGVSLAFAIGIEGFGEVLKGAHAMDCHALHPNPHENLPLLAALLGVWNRNFLGASTLAIIPYSQALVRFTAHLQQCDMESNGKHVTKAGDFVDFDTGPIIWGEPGTNGQHSFYQLIHQGTHLIPLEFIGFKETQHGEDLEVKGTLSQEKLLANLFAQSIALATGQKSKNRNKDFKGNRPNSVLLINRLTPHSLGALMAYYENKIAFQGFLWGINSFDQEGVQLGKLLANKIIDIYAQRRSKTKKEVEAFPLGEAMIKQLESLKSEKCAATCS